MIVTLDIPDELRYQLVYRMVLETPFEASTPLGYEFHCLSTWRDAVKNRAFLRGRYGAAGAAKILAKLAKGRRSLYLVTKGSEVVADGWTMLGRCAHYYVEEAAAVIGPIWTSESSRGRGLASAALKLAMNELFRVGIKTFYIDTEKQNQPAQRVFEKCGFGAPVALYLRPEGRAMQSRSL